MADGKMSGPIKAPYPYFGGKSKVIDIVWDRFGANDRYIEPFFGSGAILLANPYWTTTKEIVNDLNHYIANFWRAVQADWGQVAYYCDYPTIETELHIRHIWLVNEGREIIRQCEYDADFYDAKTAGWWVWGIANWIGSHFAAGTGCWTREALKIAGEIGNYNITEVNRQLPHLSGGHGVDRQLPHLSGGRGVNRQLPHLSGGQGEYGFPKNQGLYDYLQTLANRLIEVDVCCGDWKRICMPAVHLAGVTSDAPGACAVFLDPPYSTEANRSNVYSNEDFAIAHNVRKWCIENGTNPNLKIALCGYDIEHAELEKDHGWEAVTWSAAGGYSTFSKSEQSKKNKHREVIWFSPGCEGNNGKLF